MNLISTMAHNELICKRIEDGLNSLIDAAKESGGMCWIQSKENKEHYYELTDNVSIGLVMYPK